MFLTHACQQTADLRDNLLYNTILSDMETGYKVFRREVMQGIKLRATALILNLNSLQKSLNAKSIFMRFPFHSIARLSEGKKIKCKIAFTAIWALVKYRFVD